MVKGNKGRSGPSRQVFFCGIVVLCVLVGAMMSREESSLGMEDTSTTKSLPLLHKTPPKIKLNKDGYRMCLLPPELQYGQEAILLDPADAPLPIRYQCAGPVYEDFAAQLEAFVRNKVAGTSGSDSSWGKHAQPIPGRFLDAERHVLVLGSSHLRQVLAAVLCQYNDRVVSVERIHGTAQYSMNSFALKITLQQNIIVTAVMNPPFVYHPDWQMLLEQHVLKMPLAMVDLVIMSRLVGYNKKYATPLLEFLQDHEGVFNDGVTVNADPPSFLDLASVYEGRMIYFGGFAELHNDEYQLVVQQIEALREGKQPPADDKSGETHVIDWEFVQPAQSTSHTGQISQEVESMFTTKSEPPPTRTTTKTKKFGLNNRRRLQEESDDTPQPRANLVALDGRKYVAKLGECSTDTHEKVHTCITDPEHKRYQQGHRCFGPRGGHPDLLAYDLVDAIHGSLVMKRKKPNNNL